MSVYLLVYSGEPCEIVVCIGSVSRAHYQITKCSSTYYVSLQPHNIYATQVSVPSCSPPRVRSVLRVRPILRVRSILRVRIVFDFCEYGLYFTASSRVRHVFAAMFLLISPGEFLRIPQPCPDLKMGALRQFFSNS